MKNDNEEMSFEQQVERQEFILTDELLKVLMDRKFDRLHMQLNDQTRLKFKR